MKKLFGAIVLVICLCMAMPVMAMSFDDYYYPWSWQRPTEITVQLNGEDVDFTDSNGNKVVPQLVNDRTMVPMRKIFELLGAKVEWFEADKSIKATKDGVEINLQIDNTTATVKKGTEVKRITLDAAPMIYEDRTLVPVRFIAESLDQKVGWDDWYQTVVIMDVSFIEKEIKEKASNLYDYFSEDYQVLDAYDVSLDLDMNVKVKDDEESNTCKIKAEGEFKIKPEAIDMGGKVKLTGKGAEIEDALKELPGNLEGEVIFDLKNPTLYIKSPLLKEAGFDVPSGKWGRYQFEQEEKEELEEVLKEYIDSYKASKISISEALDMVLTDEYIDRSTYESLRMATDMITTCFGDEYFKVKETAKGKEYTYHLGKEDLVKALVKLTDDPEIADAIKEEIDNYKFDIAFNVIVEDNIARTSSITFEVAEEEYGMLVDFNGTVTAKLENYNDDVVINIPSAKNVVDLEDVYEDDYPTAFGGGSLNTASQAQFSGFAVEMGALQDSIKQAQINVRGDEMIRGHAVTEAQAYNYIARGAEMAGITPDDEGDTKWLTRLQANTIPCTPINREYATLNLDMRIRKVETDQGSNQIVSYFVTPTGNVFCWPPYIYNGKSYVNNSVTAKTEDGEEYSDTGATATNAKPVITFPNGEVIHISNKQSASLKPANVSNAKDTFNKDDISVIYKARTTDDVTGGTSYGFTFEGYTNKDNI